MDNALLIDILRPLPRPERIQVRVQVARLRKLCETDQPLEPFLQELLAMLRRLMGATAATVWLRPFGGATLCQGAREGFDERPPSDAAIKAADALVQRHWPSDELLTRWEAGPRTGVIIAPIGHGGEAVAVLQLLFDDHDDWLDQRQAYEQGMRRMLPLIEPALRRRMRIGTASLAQATAQIEQLAVQLNHIQRSIRQAIEGYLTTVAGQSFGSQQDNQAFAKQLQQLLDAHGLRLRCPECGHPAILRFNRSRDASGGAFAFDHYIDGRRTFHGAGASIPKARVIAKPKRRARLAAADS